MSADQTEALKPTKYEQKLIDALSQISSTTSFMGKQEPTYGQLAMQMIAANAIEQYVKDKQND